MPDVIVGAEEKAYVFSGASGALLRTVLSPSTGGYSFGTAVAGLVDVDGDGRGDLAVGAPFDRVAGRSQAGRVYVFSGASGAPRYVLRSPTIEEYGVFGIVLTGVRDLDGDGRGDLAVGATGENYEEGRAHLFSGASGDPLLAITAPGSGGGCLARAGGSSAG